MVVDQLILVDQATGIKFESDKFNNEISALHFLYGGLSFLNGQLEHVEAIAESQHGGRMLFGFSADVEKTFGLPEGANTLLPCFYHWFGVSAVNFVRKVGLLEGIMKGALPESKFLSKADRKKIKTYCSNYVGSVSEISEVHIWRNKVFAHFADTDPYDTDNDALIQQVSFYPISYANGRFEVGGFQLFTGSIDSSSGVPGESSEGSGLPSWSMTEIFAKFRARYMWEFGPSKYSA